MYYWIYFFHGKWLFTWSSKKQPHITLLYGNIYSGIFKYYNIRPKVKYYNFNLHSLLNLSQEENFNNFVLIHPLTQMDLAEHPRYFLLVIAKLWPKNLSRRIIKVRHKMQIRQQKLQRLKWISLACWNRSITWDSPHNELEDTSFVVVAIAQITDLPCVTCKEVNHLEKASSLELYSPHRK